MPAEYPVIKGLLRTVQWRDVVWGTRGKPYKRLINPDGPAAVEAMLPVIEALKDLLEYAAGGDPEGLPVFEQAVTALRSLEAQSPASPKEGHNGTDR